MRDRGELSWRMVEYDGRDASGIPGSGIDLESRGGAGGLKDVDDFGGAFLYVVPSGWHIAKEDPIVASDWSKPEPDLVIVRGDVDDYANRDVTAADVALVVEIADSSLAVDRTEILRVYATGGIPFYWIVNLLERTIEVYSDVDRSLGTYRSRRDLTTEQSVEITLDGTLIASVPVTDLLP